jgi:putative transposase
MSSSFTEAKSLAQNSLQAPHWAGVICHGTIDTLTTCGVFEATGRGESPIKADGGGSFAGQAHAAGCALKKTLRPAHKRTLLVEIIDHYRVSEKRACRVIQICRTSYRYRSIRDEQVPLRMRINEIAKVRVRYGYKRIHVLLRREGWQVNHKRVYRI